MHADLPAVGVATPVCLCSESATIQRARSTLGNRNRTTPLQWTPNPVSPVIIYMGQHKRPFFFLFFFLRTKCTAAFQAVINTSFSRGSQNITFGFQWEKEVQKHTDHSLLHFFYWLLLFFTIRSSKVSSQTVMN